MLCVYADVLKRDVLDGRANDEVELVVKVSEQVVVALGGIVLQPLRCGPFEVANNALARDKVSCGRALEVASTLGDGKRNVRVSSNHGVDELADHGAMQVLVRWVVERSPGFLIALLVIVFA